MENIFSHHRRTLILITLLTGLFFVIFFYLFSYAIETSSRNIARGEIDEIRQVIEAEKDEAMQHAREVGALEDIRQYIEENDSEKLTVLLDEEAKKRDLSVLMAVDKDGIVLVRTHALARKGDNVFETTPWGREAAQGNDVVTFGVGRTQPLVLIAAHSIKDEEGNVEGSIFAGYSLKDDYAQYLQKNHLSEDVEIAFYSAGQGIAGSSFEGGDKKLILSHFSTGSDWIRQEENEANVILNEQPYFLQNVVLRGLQVENPGGILIFKETSHMLRSLALAIILTILFTGLFDFFEIHKTARGHKEFIRRHFAGALFVFLLVFLTGFIASQYLLYEKAVKIESTPFTIYNSTLRLNPSFDIYRLNTEQRIGVEVETGGEAINVVSFAIQYDPEILQVEDILTNNSICPESLFIDQAIDNEAGVVKVSCGVPNGFTGSVGTVAELLVTPIGEGDFSLRFLDEDTIVLANDGLGTDVLRFAENGSYQSTLQGQTTGDIPPRVTVFSETHPNREREYNSRELQFSWIEPGDNYDYIYEFDRNPDTIPSGLNSTTNNSVSFTAASDGTYYMHVAARRGETRGPVSHYRVILDTTAPNEPIVRASSRNISVGEVVRFEFSTEDSDKLQPNYYLKINDDIFVPTTEQVYIPFFTKGKHTVTVRVFDTAGNYSDSSVEINVKGKTLWNRLFFFVDMRSLFSGRLLM